MKKLLTNTLLFPGILTHELAHYLMCKILNVEVTKFKVSITKQSGFVEHVVPKSIIKSFIISTGPLTISIILSFILLNTEVPNTLLRLVSYYLAFTILYNSLPSKEDTNFHKHHTLIKKILTYPAFIIFRLIHLLNKNNNTKTIYTLTIIIILTTT